MENIDLKNDDFHYSDLHKTIKKEKEKNPFALGFNTPKKNNTRPKIQEVLDQRSKTLPN